VNAYKTELLRSREREVGAGISYLGYRLGVLFAGAGALGLGVYFSWNSIYLLMSLVILGILVSAVFAPEPSTDRTVSKDFQSIIFNPVREFVSRKGAGWATAFFILYRLDDSMSLSMATPFLLKSGYTTGEMSKAVVSYGLVSLVLGTLLGGRAVSRFGVYRCLFIFGFLPALAELTLYALANTTHHLGLLAMWSAIEGLSAGLGNTAYTVLLMNLCHPAYTATQFALFTSLMAVGRITIATPMGCLAKILGWKAFFLCSIPLALPALLLLVRKRFPQGNSLGNVPSE
jgi:PAT family beta-lactamase induction signal transducer AmpG